MVNSRSGGSLGTTRSSIGLTRRVPATAQLHFKASFQMQAQPEEGKAWGRLLREIRKWISRRLPAPDSLGRRWYFTGGVWADAPARYGVETSAFGESEIERSSKYWAVRLVHPCSSFPFRQWATDVGVTALREGRFEIAVTNRYWLADSYVGQAPSAPPASSPRIVRNLLSLPGWKAFAGKAALSDQPELLRLGDGTRLCSFLADTDRTRPIILLSYDADTSGPLLNGHRLAELVAGNAHVLMATVPELNEELGYLLPYSHRCANGLVRIYLPRVRFDYEPDGRRHRFFTKATVQEHGPDSIDNMIVETVVRRGTFDLDPWIATLEDVEAREREVRIASLHSSLKARLSNEAVDENVRPTHSAGACSRARSR